MKYYKKTESNVLNILRVLRKAPEMGKDYLTVGEIAKNAGLHKWTVSRTVDIFLDPFVEMIVPEELEQIGLKIKLIKLNPGVTDKQVLNSLKVKS